MTGEYDDIINLQHHVSENHRPMPLINRAAQFGSFSALTGHGTAIREMARLTDVKPELDKDECDRLNKTLIRIMRWEDKCPPMVSITYFIPDSRKQGGRYCSIEGAVDKVKEDEGLILMADGSSVDIRQILKIAIM